MIILTCANNDRPRDDNGEISTTFSFKEVITETVTRAEDFGYTTVVYDLGLLGMGEPFHVEDKAFATKGYYEHEVHAGYKSKALFKPEIVKDCILKHDDLIVYLDGDALLCDPIDEVATNDYDVGVTLRDPSEFESNWYKEHIEIVKFINAGVIFFNPTTATKKFIDTWQKETRELGNDQKALNKLTCPDEYPQPDVVLTLNGVRIKYFPCKQYNYYHFEEGIAPHIKIMHFKGPVRHYYPFDWRKRLYCRTVLPVVNKIRALVK